MPTLTIEGHEPLEVEEGARLLNAILDAGVDILHRCGGFARCTTCRVSFDEGEPAMMTAAEKERLTSNEQLGEFRLSCQCAVDGDMRLRPMMLLSESGLDDAGPAPEVDITPEPQWVEREA